MRSALLLALAGALCAGFVAAALFTRPPSDDPSFRRDILPIFVGAGCTGCHGDDGGLSVSSVRSLLAGGESGPAVVPGDAGGSLLFRAITAGSGSTLQMPPEGPRVDKQAVGLIRTWIDAGARDN